MPAAPDYIAQLLSGRANLLHSTGGFGAVPLDERHPAILNICFPHSFPHGLSGARPLGMSYNTYCRHLIKRVPRKQFAGNQMLVARMYDMQRPPFEEPRTRCHGACNSGVKWGRGGAAGSAV